MHYHLYYLWDPGKVLHDPFISIQYNIKLLHSQREFAMAEIGT